MSEIMSIVESVEEAFTTTFWSDFSIADHFGLHAIADTFERAFAEWKSDYRYLTDLVITLNHKIWEHHEAGHEDYASLYDSLWQIANAYATEHLTGEELSYFYRVTD